MPIRRALVDRLCPRVSEDPELVRSSPRSETGRAASCSGPFRTHSQASRRPATPFAGSADALALWPARPEAETGSRRRVPCRPVRPKAGAASSDDADKTVGVIRELKGPRATHAKLLILCRCVRLPKLLRLSSPQPEASDGARTRLRLDSLARRSRVAEMVNVGASDRRNAEPPGHLRRRWRAARDARRRRSPLRSGRHRLRAAVLEPGARDRRASD